MAIVSRRISATGGAAALPAFGVTAPAAGRSAVVPTASRSSAAGRTAHRRRRITAARRPTVPAATAARRTPHRWRGRRTVVPAIVSAAVTTIIATPRRSRRRGIRSTTARRHDGLAHVECRPIRAVVVCAATRIALRLPLRRRWLRKIRPGLGCSLPRKRPATI